MLETNHSALMFIYETHALSPTGFVVFPVRSVSCLVFSPNSVWLFFPFLQFQPKVFSFSRYFLQFEIRDNRSLKWEIRRIPIGKILMMLLVTHTRLRLKFLSSQVECRYQREFIFHCVSNVENIRFEFRHHAIPNYCGDMTFHIF